MQQANSRRDVPGGSNVFKLIWQASCIADDLLATAGTGTNPGAFYDSASYQIDIDTESLGFTKTISGTTGWLSMPAAGFYMIEFDAIISADTGAVSDRVVFCFLLDNNTFPGEVVGGGADWVFGPCPEDLYMNASYLIWGDTGGTVQGLPAPVARFHLFIQAEANNVYLKSGSQGRIYYKGA